MTFDLTVQSGGRGETPVTVNDYAAIGDGNTTFYLRNGQFHDPGGNVLEREEVPDFVITSLDAMSPELKQKLGFGYWTTPKPAVKAAPSGKPKAVQPE